MTKIFMQSFKNWIAHGPFTQGAASAYYAIFSFPGLIIIFVGLGALLFDSHSIEDGVLSHIANILGEEAAHNIRQIVEEAQRHDQNLWAFLIGSLTLVFGATGLFAQLQASLNRIWEVEVKKTASFTDFIRHRLISLGMIIVIGFVLLISLFITTFLTIFTEWMSHEIPETLIYFMTFLNVILSFIVAGLLFSLIFKILPDVKIPWRPAIYGGMISSFLFNLGEYALTIYFNLAEPASAFGAAGSIILLMIWVSYSCAILLFGAEFAKLYAEELEGHKAKTTIISKRTS